MSDQTLIQIKNLSKFFTVERNLLGAPTAVLKAVDDVSLDIQQGEAFGLVGESGCGKTTIGKMLVDLYTPTSGSIIYNDTDLVALPKSKRRKYCKDMQLIFQDPYASLNPRMTVGEIITEPIAINGLVPKKDIADRVGYLLECVGLSKNYRNRFPHEFSGGQRQRVGIARALAMQPKLIVCDEPVSALDVSVQAQVLNLLADLKEEFGLTYLFIAHGLNVVKHVSDRVGVMYLGKLVEVATKEVLYSNPLHPYTKALLSAIPTTKKELRSERILLKGDVPSPINPAPGCRFASRCYARDQVSPSIDCDVDAPTLIEIEPDHWVACCIYTQHLDIGHQYNLEGNAAVIR